MYNKNKGRSGMIDYSGADAPAGFGAPASTPVFFCTNPDNMNFEALAKKAGYFKREWRLCAKFWKI